MSGASEKRPSLEERLWAKVEVLGREECWLWTGARNRSGYGSISAPQLHPGSRMTSVHRVAYELCVGAIPEGMVIDHTCHTSACRLGTACPHRRCCNPAHLRPKSNRDNLARQSPHRPRARSSSPKCRNGHAWSDQTLYIDPRGYWQCRICRRIQREAWASRQRQ